VMRGGNGVRWERCPRRRTTSRNSWANGKITKATDESLVGGGRDLREGGEGERSSRKVDGQETKLDGTYRVEKDTLIRDISPATRTPTPSRRLTADELELEEPGLQGGDDPQEDQNEPGSAGAPAVCDDSDHAGTPAVAGHACCGRVSGPDHPARPQVSPGYWRPSVGQVTVATDLPFIPSPFPRRSPAWAPVPSDLPRFQSGVRGRRIRTGSSCVRRRIWT